MASKQSKMEICLHFPLQIIIIISQAFISELMWNAQDSWKAAVISKHMEYVKFSCHEETEAATL